ncbi:MFS transporter [Pseudonocardia dioxanivorans]|uniref:hypothetical protein n=1 Tax=Pseudonocardia dioxanivorans TaxID=240495 RepID=UPI000CD00840|nr:hypothetical protein [Pseudonocardia dioxanivorans]
MGWLVPFWCETWAAESSLRMRTAVGPPSSRIAERLLGFRDPLVAGGIAGALLACSTLTVPVVSRIGPRRSQLAGLVALVVSLPVLALGLGSVVTVLAACLVAGLANGLLYGAATTIVSTTTSPRRARRTAAAVYSIFYLGAGLPALLVGLLTTALPLDAALTAVIVMTLVLAAVMLMIATPTAATPQNGEHPTSGETRR